MSKIQSVLLYQLILHNNKNGATASFGAELVGKMFQKKTHEFFNDISNAFGIADNILSSDFDAEGRDQDDGLQQVLCRCRHANLKLEKEKCLLR